MSETREIPLFPLNTVLFPGMALPLHIFEERYKLMIGRCIESSTPFGVVMIRSGEEIDPAVTVYDVGTTAHITQVERLPGGRMNISTLGYKRFRVTEFRLDQPYLTGIVQDFPLENQESPLAKQAARRMLPILQKYLEIFASLGNVELQTNQIPEDPVTLAFLTAIVLRTPMKDKQDLLARPDLVELLNLERRILNREAQIMKLLIENGTRWRDDPSPFSAN